MKFLTSFFVVNFLFVFPTIGQDSTKQIFAEIRSGFSKTITLDPISVRERTSYIYGAILFYEINLNSKKSILFGIGLETTATQSKSNCSFCGPDFPDNSRIDNRTRYTYLSFYVNKKFMLKENLYLRIGGSIDHPFTKNIVRKLNNEDDGKRYELSESTFDIKGFYNTSIGLNFSLEKNKTFQNGARFTLGIFCKVYNTFGVWYAHKSYDQYELPRSIKPVSFGILIGFASEN